MAPLTWDPKTPLPSHAIFEDPKQVTERTPEFEPADFDEGAQARTLTMTAAYELQAAFTGRADTVSQLSDMIERAFTGSRLAFAVVTGEPGIGKTRLLGEVVDRV